MAGHTFISYAHEDNRFVKKLTLALRERDVEIWLDQWNIPAGVEGLQTVERAIFGCRQFLLVLSPAVIDSWVVREQFRQAKKYKKTLIPLLYQACTVPAEFQETPSIDFVEQDFETALQQLLTGYFPEATPQPNPSLWRIWLRLGRRWFSKLDRLPWGSKLAAWLLLIIFVLSSVSFWSSDADDLISINNPNLERLAVVVTATSLPFTRPQDGQPMAYISAGEFLMGSDESDPLADEVEKPQRLVYVDAFWIDQTEVTNQAYGLCVEAGACTPTYWLGQNFAGADYPVVGVDWFQSNDYCRWVGGRLPTEAEWEKAARGTDGRLYPWGDRFDGERLNYCDRNCIQDWRDINFDDGYKYTSPVGIYPRGASPYGLLDMSGNVWEWTADWYAPNTYKTASPNNPTGPTTGQQRVIRGGSWHYTGRNLRVTSRHKDLPTFRYDKIGFRCVLDEMDISQ